MRRTSQSGFTLLEILVATTLMGIAVVGLLSSLSTSMRNATHITDADRASQIARNKMEELLADPGLPFQGNLKANSTTRAAGPPVAPFEAPPRHPTRHAILQRISLVVWWHSGNNLRQYPLEAYRIAEIPRPHAMRPSCVTAFRLSAPCRSYTFTLLTHVAHALLRAASTLVSTHRIPRRIELEIESRRGTQGACARQSGMTLLEVTIAVTLFAILSLGIFTALRVGFNAMDHSNDRLMSNRRAAYAARILESEINGFMPATGEFRLTSQSPIQTMPFFQGESSSMRFVSSYSLQDASRG